MRSLPRSVLIGAGYEIGSVEIDMAFAKLAEERLRPFAAQLHLDADQVSRAAEKMIREFKSCKESFGTEVSMMQPQKRIRVPIIAETVSLGSADIVRGKMLFKKYCQSRLGCLGTEADLLIVLRFRRCLTFNSGRYML